MSIRTFGALTVAVGGGHQPLRFETHPVEALQVTRSDLQAEIAAYLHGGSLRLVLDNFEHLPEAADTIAQLLQQAPSIKLLVT